VDYPILLCCCQVGFAFCFRDARNPSEPLHTWIALERSFRQFPKYSSIERPRSSGIHGTKTVEHFHMLLDTMLYRSCASGRPLAEFALQVCLLGHPTRKKKGEAQVYP